MCGRGRRYNMFTVRLTPYGFHPGAGAITPDGIARGDQLHGDTMIHTGLLTDRITRWHSDIVSGMRTAYTGRTEPLR